ncbi:tetratricopeptide repeat protein [Sphingomonas aurantiaca]|uniref:tetratricopeptide repeat protein n=1 Tax=Sphingomonas aurantiaca TaxID=185949 RepID=UPI002FE32C03
MRDAQDRPVRSRNPGRCNARAGGTVGDRGSYRLQGDRGGDLATAEQRIVAERRIFPQRPELMLNLASVYARTGRDSEARALYAAVLARPSVALDLPSGAVASSHDLANLALRRQAQQIATR